MNTHISTLLAFTRLQNNSSSQYWIIVFIINMKSLLYSFDSWFACLFLVVEQSISGVLFSKWVNMQWYHFLAKITIHLILLLKFIFVYLLFIYTIPSLKYFLQQKVRTSFMEDECVIVQYSYFVLILLIKIVSF